MNRNSVLEYCRDEVEAERENGFVMKTRAHQMGSSHI
jgi:hypothetical protein